MSDNDQPNPLEDWIEVQRDALNLWAEAITWTMQQVADVANKSLFGEEKGDEA